MGVDDPRSKAPVKRIGERTRELEARIIALADELAFTRTLVASLEQQSARQREDRRIADIEAGGLATRQAQLIMILRETEARLASLTRREAQTRRELEEALAANRLLNSKNDELERQRDELQRWSSSGAPKPETAAAIKQRIVELHKAEQALRNRQSAATQSLRTALEATRGALAETQMEFARLIGARGVYTVQSGDHLYRIANFFYHDAARWPDIKAANAPLIQRPERIRAGSVLVIPR